MDDQPQTTEIVQPAFSISVIRRPPEVQGETMAGGYFHSLPAAAGMRRRDAYWPNLTFMPWHSPLVKKIRWLAWFNHFYSVKNIR